MVLDTLKVKWPKGCMIPYHSLNQIDMHIETVCAYARARQTTSWTWLGSSALADVLPPTPDVGN